MAFAVPLARTALRRTAMILLILLLYTPESNTVLVIDVDICDTATRALTTTVALAVIDIDICDNTTRALTVALAVPLTVLGYYTTVVYTRE